METKNSVPIDKKDRHILALLVKDARTTVADIAREVGVQRDTVRYRIERMERKGLIKMYHTILDPTSL